MSARRIPVGTAVALLRAVLPISRTWRFRDPDRPAEPIRPRLEPHIYASWHEHLLPLTCLFAGQGVATLASRDRDGEIIARMLHRLGYVAARGSSSRGGATGFRELIRAAREGRPIVLTSDGPRGPRRELKSGTTRLAEATSLPLRAIGAAASSGWRLRSWDRFLIPAPGATVFVSITDPIPAGSPDAAREALGHAVARCELAAREARWSRPPAVRRLSAVAPADWDTGASPRRGGRGLVRLAEAGLRRAWTRERPALALRAAAAGFGIARDLRNGLYDREWLPIRTAGLPIVSVGGVTLGGSAKTPLVSELAGWLVAGGHEVAILTRGYPDEMVLHKRRRPEATVWGHPDRTRLARRAASEGATVALLDDGLQHRRLARDVEIIALDRDALRRTNRAGLPAGPFRERWRSALGRADLVVFTGREPYDEEVRAWEEGLRGSIALDLPSLTLGSLSLEPGPPRPANAPARELGAAAAPLIALTGIMKPNLFFDQARAGCPTIDIEIALPDHAVPSEAERSWLLEAAGEGGVLTTEKDLPRLERPFAAIPLWVIPERLVWRSGEEALRAQLRDAVPGPGR